MADKEEKVILEREYIVPLRKEWLKAAYYKRVPKAIKALKQFIAKHMKVEERDTDKVKLNQYLNHEMWARGIRKPFNKIKVKAKKMTSGIVIVELVDIPEFLKFKIDKESRAAKADKKEAKQPAKKEEKKEATEEEKKALSEKEKSAVESGEKQAEQQSRELKHEVGARVIKKPLARKALKK